MLRNHGILFIAASLLLGDLAGWTAYCVAAVLLLVLRGKQFGRYGAMLKESLG